MKLEDIKVKKIARTKYLIKQLIDLEDNTQYWNVDDFIETLKDLDEVLPGKSFGTVVKLGDDEVFYSDEFVEELIKKEFINHFKENRKIVESLKVELSCKQS